ncbi:MAG: hypothetical protein ACSLFH_07900 [Desulfuromonadales bacterium]
MAKEKISCNDGGVPFLAGALTRLIGVSLMGRERLTFVDVTSTF